MANGSTKREQSRGMRNNGAREALITITDLSKSFEEGGRTRTVLHNVDTSFAPGEFAVLLGKSGSGKSTLLNLLGGIDTPSTGEIVIDGVVLTRLSEQERTLFRRKQIGFIFQFYNLLPTLTVGENVLLPLELNGMADRAGRKRALELLDRVGLADRYDSYPDRLSGGEQQRVAIARALVNDPPLLLADEPTGNLDSATGERVMALLEEFAAGGEGEGDGGRRGTLVFVTHDPALAARAGRIVHVRDGAIEGDGRG